ncbi:MAG: hypothetical protein RI988_1392 [Pseudomonadota bacterium]
MNLRDRLGGAARLEPVATGASIPAQPSTAVVAPVTGAIDGSRLAARAYQTLKGKVHQALLERLDLRNLQTLSDERVREDLRLMIDRLLIELDLVLNANERRNLVRDVHHEIFGLGPLEPLLADPTVSDILVNSAHQVFVERRGKLELTDTTFVDDAHLLQIIDKVVSRVGRRVDESSPMVDARLPDGSRVNAVIPPLSLDGPVISIRRFSATPLRMENLVEFKALSPEMAGFLAAVGAAEFNTVISGGTGSGKTTLLNILSSYIAADERVITIEDAAELRLQQPHVVRLETRPPNIEGRGEINQRALMRNALRMRPDRIILGETRGPEAVDMLQAMNTGHEGSMTTIHANTPRDAVARMESMVAMSGVDLPPRAARAQIASAVTIIVQVNRMTDGSRKVTSIAEITGMEGDTVSMQEIFFFKQTGVNAEGRVQGYFSASGVRPRCAERILTRGIQLPDTLFLPARLVV